MIHRRRRIFLFLVLSASATLLVGLIPAFRGLLRFHLIIDFVLAGYVIYLIRLKQQVEEDVEEEDWVTEGYEESDLGGEESPGAAEYDEDPQPYVAKPDPIYEPSYAEAEPTVPNQQTARRYTPRHSAGAALPERPKARRILLPDGDDDQEVVVAEEGYPRAKEA